MKRVTSHGWPVPKILCDICREEPATVWFGNTSRVICDNEKCYQIVQKNFAEHCAALEETDRDDS